MDILANLSLGFSTAFSLGNLFYCFVGVVLGTLVGVLPGLGPVATIAMLLPITFNFQPVTALIMLAGIFYGAQYGGSTTAILVNLPGEASSVITALDGHAMAKRGEAEGTWHASHFSWRLRSVAWAAVLYIVTAPLWLLFFVPGWIAWALISLWFLYRIVKGMVRMNAGQPMEIPA